MKVFARALPAVTALALPGSLPFRPAPGPEAGKWSAKRYAKGRPLDNLAQATGGPAPKAEAGFGQSLAAGDTAVLEGGGAGDPKGDEPSFTWSFESLPTGSLALISDPAAIKPDFQAVSRAT